MEFIFVAFNYKYTKQIYFGLMFIFKYYLKIY